MARRLVAPGRFAIGVDFEPRKGLAAVAGFVSIALSVLAGGCNPPARSNHGNRRRRLPSKR